MSDAALLLIDVQQGPAVGGTAPIPPGHGLIPIFNDYAQRFAHAGHGVFLTRSGPDVELQPGLHLPAGTTIVTRRNRAADASVLSADDPRGRPLATALAARGVGTLYIGGLAAEETMDATVRAALPDFDVVILIDAVRGTKDAPDADGPAFGALLQAGARVATLRTINEFIAGIEPGARGR